jgi:hypothetical protein
MHGSTAGGRALQLFSAIAEGDAEVGDIVAELSEEGIDSVQDLVAAMQEVARSRTGGPERVDFRKPAQPTPRELVEQIVHQVPELPVLVNGTLHDPQDISRFDGTELHSVLARTGDHLIALDDRSTMETWWQLLALSGMTAAPVPPVAAVASGPTIAPQVPPMQGADSIPGSHFPQVPPGSCRFWSDMNYQGDEQMLGAGRQYSNLLDVGRGFLGAGDWNDVISSFLWSAHVTSVVLFEHIHFQGSSHTSFTPHNFLDQVGWNDRASSVRCL